MILQRDLLVFQQTKNFTKNDFAIMDREGLKIGHVETGGSTLRRLFAGSRELTLYDDQDNPVLQVKDTMGLGRDRMQILDGQGNPVASLLKRITLFKTRIAVEVQGEQLELSGNIWDFDFQIAGPCGVIATVSRQWSGMGNALLGMSTYALQVTGNPTPAQRQAVLGAVLALDLIREKKQRNSNG